MFKQFIKDQHLMVTSIGDTLETPSDKVVFYTSFWGALVGMTLLTVVIIMLPFHLIRKAF